MRTRLLDFLDRVKKRPEPTPRRDFWRLDPDTIPDEPGVYVLIADHWFVYPRGRSPVFYVGQSENLRRRLRDHLKYATAARNNERDSYRLYWPRYEYAARFAKSYAFVRTWQRLTPKALEEEAMASFARKYYAFPVANSAGSWNRITKHFRP